ncbi:plasma membrane fusion protein PRM1 [Pseudohyphozyma bogoriensis]|nr:plasma membrane fusion protein PRM1 [Pseudohyphozyma bogoriensis]
MAGYCFALENQLTSAVTTAKSVITASCSSIDQVASYAVSMPHYLATGTNAAIHDEIDSILQHAASGLGLAVEALEGVVDFVINAMLGPYLCIVQFVLDAALLVLEEALKLVDEAVNKAADGIATVIEDAVKVFNDVIDGLDKIPFVNIKKVSVNVDSISNVHLDLADDLSGAVGKIPSATDLTATIQNLIDSPLEDLKNLITTSIDSINIDVSLFPVPDRDTVEFCSGNGKFVDTIAADLRQVITWMLYALAGAAILLFIVLAIRAWWEYKLRLAYVETVRQSFFPENDLNPKVPSTAQLLAFYEAAKSPAISMALGSATGHEKRSWFINYVTHPPVVPFFFLGVIGILVIEGQLVMMSSGFRDKAQALVADAISDFADDIRGALNDHLNATSALYAGDANGVINGISDGWDDSIGTVLEQFTLFVNTTSAYDQVTSIITDLFGTGPYGNDVQNLLTCVVGSKVTMLEEALTWVNENANLAFPQVSDTVFLLSDSQTNDIVADATGSGSNSSLSEAIEVFIDRYQSTLESSRWLYLIYLAIVGYVLIAATIGVTSGGNTNTASPKPKRSSESGTSSRSSSTRSGKSTTSRSLSKALPDRGARQYADEKEENTILNELNVLDDSDTSVSSVLSSEEESEEWDEKHEFTKWEAVL